MIQIIPTLAQLTIQGGKAKAVLELTSRDAATLPELAKLTGKEVLVDIEDTQATIFDEKSPEAVEEW